ncbi:hypothetical protein L249_3984 [Ophiocordyceps polyrhachis-furcata BCC 54312]|uniref:Argonaute complex, subunit Arb1 n=1 Tax=Ophiocordyceps polyrhachis-furcata BCC 54312 TaxID=1330021 RepID=A0A367L5Z8_9HYPO|nr:hypothetical protein L249_3984 [Ophiocordyceps polyrhachis-furcata BCC 54312]
MPSQQADGGDAQPQDGITVEEAKLADNKPFKRLPKNRGTGFEEYFADPPMTPAEAAEERDQIYSRFVNDAPVKIHSTDQHQRYTIRNSCIQRFRARRRLPVDKTRFFNEYLFLGGIDTSANQFGGQDHRDLRDLTPAERRDATATDTVHTDSFTSDRFYHAGDENWTVDFTAIVAGFFSTSLMLLTGGNQWEMDSAADLIENFLRYVKHHDVCPEYQQDVDRALLLCADARREWQTLDNLRGSFPGRFHLAASHLFSPPSDSHGWACTSFSHTDQLDHKAVFYSACALLGETEALAAAKRGSTAVAREYSCTLQVVSIEQPSVGLADRFRSLFIDQVQHHPSPIGKAFFKPATIEDGWIRPTTDVPDDEAGTWLYFEKSILDCLKPGTKMALTIVELSVGIRFVKAWSNLVPTYYTFLPQVLMKHYKMPKPDERPAPSVHDPDADEKRHKKEAHGA